MRTLTALVLVLVVSIPAFAQSDPEVEAKLLARIPALITAVKAEKYDCEHLGANCNATELATLRHDLNVALAGARKAVADLTKTIEDPRTKEDAKPALKERREMLNVKIDKAEAFNVSLDLPSGGSAVGGDRLVEHVKTVSDLLTDAQNKKREAEEEARQARRQNDTVAAEAAEQTANEWDKRRRELRSRLAQLERRLRAQGLADRGAIKKIDETLKSGKLDLDYNKLVADRKTTAARLGEIESLVTLPAEGNPLYRVFDDDYEDWWVHTFYAGMEFDSVSKILNKGFARIGYTNTLHVGGEGVPETQRGWGRYGVFYDFNALLTSSAEQSLSKGGPGGGSNDPCSGSYTGTDPCVRKAFEAEEKIFVPILRTTRHNRLRHYFGPVASLGARFIDEPASNPNDGRLVTYRTYIGTHLGFARDGYGEILYGRTSGVNSRRLEFRGEVPVAHWGKDSRLLLGWSANFRAGNPRKDPPPTDKPAERDSFRVYVTYNLDFLKLTGLKAPKEE